MSGPADATPTPIPTPSLTTSDAADPAAPVVGQAMRFAVVGTLSTGLHFVIFSLLDLWWGNAQAANIAALVLSTVANTAANRSWTFGTLLNLLALTIATGISMVLRFLAMRYWVFKAA